MNSKKLSFVNIAILLAVFGAACALTLNGASHRAATFSSIEELVVYPSSSRPTIASAADVSSSIIPEKAAVQPVHEMTLPLAIFPPVVRSRVLPEYPAAGVQRGLEGVVILRVFVSEVGAAEEIVVKVSSGEKILDDSASSAISKWVFDPARRGAAAISSWLEVPIRFKISND